MICDKYKLVLFFRAESQKKKQNQDDSDEDDDDDDEAGPSSFQQPPAQPQAAYMPPMTQAGMHPGPQAQGMPPAGYAGVYANSLNSLSSLNTSKAKVCPINTSYLFLKACHRC